MNILFDRSENLSCKSSTIFRIVSQKNGTEDLIGTFKDRIFNKEWSSRGFPNFISFAELLDPSKGFYNKDENKVKLAIDVIIDEPKTEKIISDPNKSNGTLSMEIEKMSEFAREIFGSECKSETLWKLEPQMYGNTSIVSQKSDVGDFTRKYDHVFNNNSNDWGFVNFISFAELMDPRKGLYNKDEDKVTLAIDFACE